MSLPVSVRRTLVFVLALSFTGVWMDAQSNATGAATAEIPDGFQSTAEQLRAASSAVPVNTDFDAQILLEEGTYHVEADGTLSYRHRLIYRVDSSAGVANWAEISMQWDPWFENPAQLQARVLEPSGKFATLEEKTITDAPVKADDSETFSSEHVRRAPLPGVEIGSIVEQVETVKEKTPYFAAGSLYRFTLSSGVPAAKVRVVVDIPATLPYKDLLHNLPTVSVQRTEADGRRAHCV